MEYKFLIGGSNNDYYIVSYRDIMQMDNVTYCREFLQSDSKLLKWIYTHHFGVGMNRFVELPFKSVWNRFYLKNSFSHEDQLCILLFANYLQLERFGLVEFLRKRYPNARIVCFYQDIAATVKAFPPEKAKSEFDLVLSFDQRDCDQYGWVYYPLVYSMPEISDDPSIEKSDVYFVGKAKNRLNDIYGAYERLTAAGLKCDFHITGVSEQDRKYTDSIVYRDVMPYEENLKRINKTRCMLEIMQKGGHGYTLRYCEAIAQGKCLITNNPEIANAPFYSPERISVFGDVDAIDLQFVVNSPWKVDYNYIDKLSPVHLLEFLEKYFTT